MRPKFSPAQRAAMRLARRGTLVRCARGYKSAVKHRRVAAGTVNSLLARGWFVVSKTTPGGAPIEVDSVGKQTELPLQSAGTP